MILKHRSQEIILSKTPNPHLLVWGSSGMGKTYFLCRKLEEESKTKRKTLVIDYTGSYTREELKKAHFELPVLEYNPFQKPLYWSVDACNEQDFASHLTDILVSSLEISGYWQRRILLECISSHLLEYGHFNFADFYRTLECLYEKKQLEEVVRDELANFERLLARFYTYREIDKFFLCLKKSNAGSEKYSVFLLQLSDFPISQRNFLTILFSEILWLETKRKTGQHCYDTLLFDEFQHVPLTPDSALSQFLREGRRFGISLLLCSQFVSTYSREELETLFQAGNVLIFRPNDHDMKFSARILDNLHPEIWLSILRNLKIGEAVLKGHYHLRNKTKILTSPVTCKIPRCIDEMR